MIQQVLFAFTCVNFTHLSCSKDYQIPTVRSHPRQSKAYSFTVFYVNVFYVEGCARLQKNIGLRPINRTLLRNDFCENGPLYGCFVWEIKENATF